ncbi:MAG: hypothetical protein AAF747_00895 [Planctomycetota bacterium]
MLKTTLAVFVCAGAATAQTLPATIDFSVDGQGNTIQNAQVIGGNEFADLFTLTASGNNQGAAIFDSNPGVNGNVGDPDTDLIVGLGNILIFQDNQRPSQTNGFFDEIDDALSGTFTFDFAFALTVESVTLVDIDNAGNGVDVTLTDANGLTRTYDVAKNFTFDLAEVPVSQRNDVDGFDVLDLLTLDDQVGEAGGIATAAEELGFDQNAVVQLEVQFNTSGGLDNLVLVPTPASAAMLAGAGLLGMRRRR